MSLEPKICPICGESFTPVNKKQLYCSISCKHKANYEQRKDYHRDYYQKNSQKHKDYQKENSKKEKSVLEKTCPICENIFQTHDSRKKYCSDECYKESVKRQMKEQNNKKKHILTKICPVCSQEFETTDSKKIFCSQECYRANQLEKEKEKAQTLEYKKAHIERQNRYMAKKNPPVEKTCPICETVFTTTDSRKKYCSEECKIEAQKINAKHKKINVEKLINKYRELENSESQTFLDSYIEQGLEFSIKTLIEAVITEVYNSLNLQEFKEINLLDFDTIEIARCDGIFFIKTGITSNNNFVLYNEDDNKYFKLQISEGICRLNTNLYNIKSKIFECPDWLETMMYSFIDYHDLIDNFIDFSPSIIKENTGLKHNKIQITSPIDIDTLCRNVV